MDAEEDSSKKTWIPQMLHSHKTHCTARTDQNEQIDKTCIGRRTGTCANGSLKHHKYQDIEAEVEETGKWYAKTKKTRG